MSEIQAELKIKILQCMCKFQKNTCLSVNIKRFGSKLTKNGS